jgi:hypothetical protein
MKLKSKATLVFSLVGTALVLMACSEPSIAPPVPGNAGTIVFTDITADEVKVVWTEAADTRTSQDQLEYKVVYSTALDIETPEKAESNGVVLTDWTADIAAATATGLSSGTTYFFNVIVRDEDGNKEVYVPASVDTTTDPQPYLIMADFSETLYKILTDGSSSTVLLDDSTVQIGTPTGVAVEQENGVVYWTDFFYDSIMKANVDGSEISLVLDGGSGDVVLPFEVELDEEHGVLYWLNRSDSSLKRVTVDGSAVETVISNSNTLDEGWGLELDPATKTLYWTNFSVGSTPGLFSVSTDGTDQKNVVTGSAAGDPRGIALNPQTNELYWADYANGKIRKVNTDGTGVADVTGSGLTSPEGLLYRNGILYITDNGTDKLYSYNLSSGSLTELGGGYDTPNDLDYYAP